MLQFSHNDYDDAKAIAFTWVYSKNGRANNVTLIFDLDLDR